MSLKILGPIEINSRTSAADLVTIEPRLVVMQDLSNSLSGIARVYAFDENTELGIGHHSDAFVMALHGKAEYAIEGDSGLIQSGEIMKLPANQAMMIKASSPFKILLLA